MQMHEVIRRDDGFSLIYIDRHILPKSLRPRRLKGCG